MSEAWRMPKQRDPTSAKKQGTRVGNDARLLYATLTVKVAILDCEAEGCEYLKDNEEDVDMDGRKCTSRWRSASRS